MEGHTSYVRAVCVTNDGKTVVSGSWDKTARVWTASGDVLRGAEGHSAAVTAIATLPNGDVFTGSLDRSLRWWHGATGEVSRR
jgi:WD40 repeat protein